MTSEGHVPTWYLPYPESFADPNGTRVTTVKESPSGVASLGQLVGRRPDGEAARRELRTGFSIRASGVPMNARNLPLKPRRSGDAMTGTLCTAGAGEESVACATAAGETASALTAWSGMGEPRARNRITRAEHRRLHLASAPPRPGLSGLDGLMVQLPV